MRQPEEGEDREQHSSLHVDAHRLGEDDRVLVASVEVDLDRGAGGMDSQGVQDPFCHVS